jgi:hypothetical protein
MYLLAPDILQKACELSLPVTVTALVVGLFLWLFGWWTHRFWVVLVMTVLGGIFGLYEGPLFRAQPMLASLLLALAAGMLALALVRLLAFAAGGLTGLLTLQIVAPAWHQPVLGFLACGVLGLVLFRLWMMVLTSFTGTLLMAYSGLCLLNRAGTVDAVAWIEQGAVLLNWLCGLLTMLGLVAQYLLDRRRLGQSERKSSKSSRESAELLWTILPFWGARTRKAG